MDYAENTLHSDMPRPFSEQNGETVFAVIWNLPGCLPEMEPMRFAQHSAALEALIEEVESAQEEAERSMANGVGTGKQLESMEERHAEELKRLRDGAATATQIGSYVYSIGRTSPEDDEEAKSLALALHLECELDDVDAEDENFFSAEGEEWLIVDDETANDLWEQSLDSYLEDCILCELPEMAQRYFDEDAWKRDARHDGRGHAISHYDGSEEDSECGRWVMFRMN